MVLVRTAMNPTLKGHKILVLTPWDTPQEYLAGLRSRFPDLEVTVHKQQWDVIVYDDPIPESCWDGVTILVTGSCLPTLEQAPKLQFVQLLSAGANFILDKPLFTDTDIAFCTSNGVHGPQITEWMVSTFLAAKRKLPQYLEFQRDAHWKRLDEPDDAVGQRVGILGYGSIGRQAARVCKAMGMDVHAYTLHPRDTPSSRRDNAYTPPGLGDPDGTFPSKWYSGGSTADLHSFLGSGLDWLIVSTPLTAKTNGLISRPEFEVLGRHKTFLTNISRGPIVNTDDLIHALDSELIRGAAIDVTDPEPLPDGHKLWSAKNLIITPHISGQSTSYSKRALAILEHNLERFSLGKKLTNRVSRKDGY